MFTEDAEAKKKKEKEERENSKKSTRTIKYKTSPKFNYRRNVLL